MVICKVLDRTRQDISGWVRPIFICLLISLCRPYAVDGFPEAGAGVTERRDN